MQTKKKKLIFIAESFFNGESFLCFFFFSFCIFSCFAKKRMTVQRGDCFLAHTITDNDFSFVYSCLSLSSPLSTHKCLLFIHPRRKIGKKRFFFFNCAVAVLWLHSLIFASLPGESNQKLHKKIYASPAFYT